MFLIAAHEEVGRGVEVAVEDARDAVLRVIRLASGHVRADLVGLEERTKAVILLLRKGVVLVVVTSGAVERQAEERFRGVLDDLLEPGVAVEEEVRPGEEAGGAKTIEVV